LTIDPIHQEARFKASPNRVYEALLDSNQHGRFTGGGATEISREVGGRFSAFGGMIVGQNLELIPNQRIVQAWRSNSWDPGLYSVVKFDLKSEGSNETLLTLDHWGYPEGEREHLVEGWNTRYWGPLQKYLDEM
jgi:uncharacterized protein YndB with AHSA1/START domain